MATFDGNYLLSYSFSSNGIATNSNANEIKTFLGNGKIGLETCADYTRLVSSVYITASSSSPKTKYVSNCISTFNTFGIQFAQSNVFNPFVSSSSSSFSSSSYSSLTLSSNAISNLDVTLDMSCAIFNASWLLPFVPSSNLSVSVPLPLPMSCDIYVPQGLPFCTVQTIKFGANLDSNMSIPFQHNIQSGSLLTPYYNNNVVFDNVGNQPIYVMTGTTSLLETRDGNRERGLGIEGNREVAAFATSYVFENVTSTNLGFNVFAENQNQAFNFFNLSKIQTSSRVHIITAHMTSYDFDDPVEEAKRVVLNVVNRSISTVRSDHVKQWTKMWRSDVNVIPKQAITQQESSDIMAIRQRLRYGIYTIYSSVRENVSLDVNPSVIGFVDRIGTVLYSGDMSLIPLLLLLKPETARSILDYRYKTLGIARQLAAGYGFSGAKYPYQDDRLGYKNALYWNTTSSLTVYNNALVAINAWNFFRTTKDVDWLRTSGYAVLKEVAAFFSSLIERSTDDENELGPNPPGPGGYSDPECPCHASSLGIQPSNQSITNVVSLSGRLSLKNNAFTNTLVRLAMRFAIEASYELSLPVPEIWIDLIQGLPIPLQHPDILKVDEATVMNDQTDYPIAETLFLFTPNFSAETERKHENIAYTGIDYQTMLLHNLNQTKPSDPTNPLNQYVTGLLQGLYAQSDPSYTTQFKQSIQDFIATNQTDIWGGMGDITISALFVLMVVQGMTKLSVVGGVAPTRFYYHELGLESLTSANMPPTWKSVRIGQGLKAPLITHNVLYYS
jgi:hypothetical protein